MFAGRSSNNKEHRHPGQSVAGNVSKKAHPFPLQRQKDPVIQRITIEEYLSNIKKGGQWEESYEEDFQDILEIVSSRLLRVRATPTLLTGPREEFYTLRTLQIVSPDGKPNLAASEESWKTYIRQLNSLNIISKPEFDVYLFCCGEKAGKPGLGDLRSLAFDQDKIVGRPSFHGETNTKLETKAKQHRRHIIAWHNIREFANKAYAAMGTRISEIIDPLLAKLEKLKLYHETKAKVEKLTGLDDTKKKLLVAVFIMNSNPANLWVGEGKENSGINTAGATVLAKMNAWKHIDGIFSDIDEWDEKEEAATVTGISKKQVFDLICQFLTQKEFPSSLMSLTNKSLPLKNRQLRLFYGGWTHQTAAKTTVPVKSKESGIGSSKPQKEKEESLVVFQDAELEQRPTKPDMSIIPESVWVEGIVGTVKQWIISHLEFDVGFTEKDTSNVMKRNTIMDAIPLFYKTIFEEGPLDKESITSMFTALLTVPENFFAEQKDEDKK